MRTVSRATLALLCCTPLLVSCAPSSEPLEPMPEVQTVSPGTDALLLPLFPESARWGDAALWSRGAFLRHVGDARQAVVHAAIRITNLGDRPLTVRSRDAAIEIETDRGDRIPEVSSFEEKETRVAPRGQESIELYFPLPADVSPRAVHSFTLRWKVTRGTESIARTVTFREEPPPEVVYYDDPFWPPAFYPRGPYFFYPRYR